MTLTEYKRYIDKLVKEGHGNKEVIFCMDEEGNSYDDVPFAPSILDIKDIRSIYVGKAKGEVICIN